MRATGQQRGGLVAAGLTLVMGGGGDAVSEMSVIIGGALKYSL